MSGDRYLEAVGLPSKRPRGRPKKIPDNNTVDVRYRDSQEEVRKIEDQVGYPDPMGIPDELVNIGNPLLPDDEGRLTNKTARYLGFNFVPKDHRSTWILMGMGVLVFWYVWNRVSQ